jgi:hypothetical protein
MSEPLFNVNTRSNTLHRSATHPSEGENTVDYDRADKALIDFHKQGIALAFCKTCFTGSKNTMSEEEVAAEQAAQTPAGSDGNKAGASVDARSVSGVGDDEDDD